MRKVVLFVHVSLDGYAARPNGELNWIFYDEELQDYASEIESNVGSPSSVGNKFPKNRVYDWSILK